MIDRNLKNINKIIEIANKIYFFLLSIHFKVLNFSENKGILRTSKEDIRIDRPNKNHVLAIKLETNSID